MRFLSRIVHKHRDSPLEYDESKETTAQKEPETPQTQTIRLQTNINSLQSAWFNPLQSAWYYEANRVICEYF